MSASSGSTSEIDQDAGRLKQIADALEKTRPGVAFASGKAVAAPSEEAVLLAWRAFAEEAGLTLDAVASSELAAWCRRAEVWAERRKRAT